MWIIDVSYYVQITSLVILILSTLAITIILYRACKTGEEIKKKTYELGKELTAEKVKDYINFIDNTKIPERKVYWNTLRAGYRLIEMDKHIADEMKGKLRVVMLSRGVLV